MERALAAKAQNRSVTTTDDFVELKWETETARYTVAKGGTVLIIQAKNPAHPDFDTLMEQFNELMASRR